MTMGKIIIPTGYIGSGSSAATDLISEFEGVFAPNNYFEYVFLHCPNGVFDLEDKLLSGNNSLRSDEAIHSFLDQMRILYKKSEREYWVAGYRECFSNDFMRLVNEFIDRIDPITFEGYWYAQHELGIRGAGKAIARRIISKLSFHKLSLGPSLKYRKMSVCYPSSDTFYEAAREFIGRIIQPYFDYHDNIILDQLLLPHNLDRMSKYFDDQTYVIVVERDPRDVFLSNKYFWRKKMNQPVPYPIDAELFAKMYMGIRNSEKIINNDRILRIYFEDLVYNCESTRMAIQRFLGISDKAKVHRFQKFDPGSSIQNTQLFKMNQIFKEESDIIEKYLNKFLYPFPEVDLSKDREVF